MAYKAGLVKRLQFKDEDASGVKPHPKMDLKAPHTFYFSFHFPGVLL